MKLTAKLLSVFTLAAACLVGVNGCLTVQRDVDLFEAEIAAQHRQLGAALERMVVDLWRSTGRGRVFELFTSMQDGQQKVQVRWVWLGEISLNSSSPLATSDVLATVAAGKAVSIKLRGPNEAGLFVTYFPIPLPGEPPGALEISESLARRDTYTSDTIRRTVILLGSLFAVSALLMGLVGVRMVGRPLRRLIEFTRLVGSGDLSGRVELHNRDELSELATALNQMCARLAESQQQLHDETVERVETLEQLRHGDRLRTVGRLAAGVAHELGTPLNVVAGRAGLIASGQLPADDIASSAETIQSEAARMTTIIRQLLDFARRSAPMRSRVDVRDVVRQTVSLLEPLARKRGAELHIEFDQNASVTDEFFAEIDSGQIQQVISNVVLNAVQSRDEGAIVTIDLRAETSSDGDSLPGECVIIDVADNGCGIAPEHLPHLFDPFFTTKETGQGTGLGLSIAYGIVAEHDGRIDVASVPDQGSRFTIRIPVNTRPQQS